MTVINNKMDRGEAKECDKWRGLKFAGRNNHNFLSSFIYF